MRNAIPLFKLLGIEVGLDYSWFLVFLLIVWSLTGHYLMAYPGWSAGFRLILAVVTAILFFASILAHEFGHSLVAIRTGVPVRRITLFIFGGVAQLTREPRRALDEFLMALAGPAVSLVLVGSFGALWLLGRLLGWQPVTVLAGWLGGINLMLALFNLVPGFPLDGGRVFRAIVWGVTGSLTRATRIAGRIGQGVAFLFILWGIWQAFGGNWANGLWIAFIGWFLHSAAAGSLQQMTLRDVLENYTARDVMWHDCPRVPRSLTLEQLVYQAVLPRGRRCFPVVENGRTYGLVTLHHVRDVPQRDWATTTVGDVMIPLDQLQMARPDEGLYDVLERMTVADVNQMPVMEDGHLLGMVARDRVLALIRTRAELGLESQPEPLDLAETARNIQDPFPTPPRQSRSKVQDITP